jgi:hypothetical protein
MSADARPAAPGAGGMRLWVRAGVLAAWLVMVAWLVRYKAFPEYFSHSVAGYSGFISRDMLSADSWMKVLLNGAPIGYSHTSMDLNDSDFSARFAIHNRLDIQLTLLGGAQSVYMDSSAYLDGFYDLQRFSLRLGAASHRMTMSAERTGKTAFRVRTTTADSSQRTTVEIPDDVILYSPMTEIAMKRLKPGQELVMRTLDPATLSPVRLTIKALRRETVSVGGRSYEATVLSSEQGGMTVLTWLDGDGSALRQETPFGWTLERCSPEEAFASLRQGGSSPEALAGFAVKVEGHIRDPRGCKALTLRLSGVEFQRGDLETARQSVLKLDGTNAEVRVLHERPPAEAVDRGGAVPQEPLGEFLKPSRALQSDDPEMVERAMSITAGCGTPAEKAVAIHEWVYKHVTKAMTVSLPSALDVLKSLRGDCNEHTYLYVALARAAGLPAKILVGVAFSDGKFYYHAWPAVYTGRWVEMDPTWGDRAVDATHIALVQGELTEQMKLIRILGKLRIEVLDEVAADDKARGRAGQGVDEP